MCYDAEAATRAAADGRSWGIDPDSPQPARRYNAWLGGKDNFAADRLSAAELTDVFPSMPVAVRENRRFLRRCVRFLAEECGIRQFLDIGVGLPDEPNVHEIAQAVDPSTRVVYVDNDPLVGVHARALLTGTGQGATVFVLGDVRDPKPVLAQAREVLDFDQPIGLLMIAVLHFVGDGDDPYGAVRHLVADVPVDSYVALSHATFDSLADETASRLTALARSGRHGPFRARTRADVARFLDGLDLIEPGLVPTVRWRPGIDPIPDPRAGDADVVSYAAVARVTKPVHGTAAIGRRASAADRRKPPRCEETSGR